MRSIAALLAVALLVLASCTPGSSDPDPTRAPTAEPSEQRAAPSRDSDCGPCTDRCAGDAGCDTDDYCGNP